MSPLRVALPALMLPLLWAPTATAAADDPCFGQVPTIVGTPGESVTGTEGPDVILTNGADRVRSLGGDDLICVAGKLRRYLDAGTGDDRVSTERANYGARIRLGSGADTFVGGPDNDYVNAGDQLDVAAGQPPSADHITTGGGHDEVTTGAANDSTAPNDDVLALGPESDSVQLRGRTVPSINAGGGSNVLRIASSTGGEWSLDASTGDVSVDDVTMGPLLNFHDFRLYSLQWDELHFVGSDDPEDLDLVRRYGKVGPDGPISIGMGGGADNLWTRSQDVGSVGGGPGKDWLRVEADKTTSRITPLFADLEKGIVRLAGSEGMRLDGWEKTSFTEANFSTINATARDDDLVVWGCGNTIRGRGGDDVLTGYDCDGGPKLGVRIDGGAGNDYLTGTLFRDQLIGGPGRDRADGRGGGDRCAVEIKGYGC